ncbi:HAD family phosphatase [Desulfonatronospira sp.]|uniref:HAD family hydrolase n=1 Tax=Desulfonatronospira sp. TaxID=1962951 RepID=UPI0025BB3809|nr:HAD family phosphatase [Desulfonatronospira sp.]
MGACKIELAVFDYGGVLAEEGFVAGLNAMADRAGLDRDFVFQCAREVILSTGYLTGQGSEDVFWDHFKAATGIKGNPGQLRHEIISRFQLRPWMLSLMQKLKALDIGRIILSDQVNWLDELEARDNFFRYFDAVYNSYHMGKSKNDASLFDDLLDWTGAKAQQTLFVDDHLPHVQRASSRGIAGIYYTGREDFLARLEDLCPDIERD